MKKSLILTGLIGFLVTAPHTASADNKAVENALDSRSDLLSFYQAARDTGVLAELRPNVSYTVFAPTNAAFAVLSRDRYPCFYSPECQKDAAAMLRNHFIQGEVYVSDVAAHKGGVYSINSRFINVGEQGRNRYIVDGKDVLYMSWFNGGILYKIDGIIASPRELSALETETVERVTTQSEKYVIPDPACGPQGCPDRATQTTTVTRTVVTPAP